jgi:hypothetical protein
MTTDEYYALPARTVSGAHLTIDPKEWQKVMNSPAKLLNHDTLGQYVNIPSNTSSIPEWAKKANGGASVFGAKVLAEYAENYTLTHDGHGPVIYDITITQDKLARLLEGRSHMEELDTSFLEEQIANYDDQLDATFIKGYLAAIEVLNERKYLEDYLPE